MVTNAPADVEAAVCTAIVNNSDVVDSAFVQALSHPGLSDTAQHALVVTLASIYLKIYDVCNDPSSALMKRSPLVLPILLRIIAQEQPVATCRCCINL
jgi:hypothetical protein